jgi:hypothetical protein
VKANGNKKKVILVSLALSILVLIGVVFGESIWNIISNILGPYPIHVGPKTSQLLTITASNPPQSISLGQTVNMTLTVENPTSSDVQGYVLINITSTSSFASNNVSLTLRSQNFGGWSGEFPLTAVYIISGGYVYKISTKFTWKAGCRDTANLYIVFNKQGDYVLTIAISSN